MHTYIHYIHTYIPTYLPTYLPTYVRTYVPHARTHARKKKHTQICNIYISMCVCMYIYISFGKGVTRQLLLLKLLLLWPRLDLFITLLSSPQSEWRQSGRSCHLAMPRSLGASGWTGLLQERKENAKWFEERLSSVSEKLGLALNFHWRHWLFFKPRDHDRSRSEVFECWRLLHELLAPVMAALCNGLCRHRCPRIASHFASTSPRWEGSGQIWAFR